MGLFIYILGWILSTLAMGVMHKKRMWIFSDWKPSGVDEGGDHNLDVPPHMFIGMLWPIGAVVGSFWGAYFLVGWITNKAVEFILPHLDNFVERFRK